MAFPNVPDILMRVALAAVVGLAFAVIAGVAKLLEWMR